MALQRRYVDGTWPKGSKGESKGKWMKTPMDVLKNWHAISSEFVLLEILKQSFSQFGDWDRKMKTVAGLHEKMEQ